MNATLPSSDQYATPKNLQTRISIHDKYSVNRQGFGSWIFDQYEIRPGARILELGCGTGVMWKGRIDSLPAGASLVLSDLSPGMLAAARENLGEDARVAYRQVDIQEIPFPDGGFDVVIANMMLYHVPDLDRGLAEVRRVLRPGGTFYCATYGEHGMAYDLAERLPALGLQMRQNTAFTLQNGGERLARFFSAAEQRLYPDALRVTDTEDLVDYLYSLAGLIGLGPERRDEVCAALRGLMRDGVLEVRKEYGLFVCR